MKSTHFLYTLLILFTVVASSCNKKLNVTTDKDMSLSVSGGMSIEMQDNDITKNIVVSCSSPAQEDIIVDISTSATADDATLSTTQVIIKKGTKTVAAQITFKIAAFPENAPEKVILVRISSTNRNVIIEKPSTEFPVKGFVPFTLKAEVNNTEFNTFEGDVELIVTLTLSKTIATEAAFALSLGDQSSNIFKELFTELPGIKIAADALTASASLTIPRSTEGTLLLNINSSDENLVVETTSFSITFISEKVATEEQLTNYKLFK